MELSSIHSLIVSKFKTKSIKGGHWNFVYKGNLDVMETRFSHNSKYFGKMTLSYKLHSFICLHSAISETRKRFSSYITFPLHLVRHINISNGFPQGRGIFFISVKYLSNKQINRHICCAMLKTRVL